MGRNAGGEIERHEVGALDEKLVMRLARQIAAFSHQGVSREHPLLSATLPDGARVQIVAPPATRDFPALAIRKHVSADLTLADYAATGAFDATAVGALDAAQGTRDALRKQLEAGDITGALSAAVRARLTILVSGGTSSGKTTFLNSLIREIPEDERLILIEDTPELRFTTPTSSACSPRGAALAKRRSPPTTLSPPRCACGPTASFSASCAVMRPMPSCARSTPAIPDR